MKDFLFQKVYAGAVIPNASGGRGISFDRFFSNIKDQIITPIIYLLFTLAMVYFLYGVFVFVKNAENPDKRSEGAKGILWGIIGMFIMISVWGIINIILSSIGAI
jgi:hypothetical protein